MFASNGCWLTGFTAYELPPEKWVNLFSPKMRLRVCGNGRNFVSSDVKVDNQEPRTQKDATCTHWSVDEWSSLPSFAGHEAFEIFIERRFLLWYKCIRRTKSVIIDQVCAGLDDRDSCTLSLYDGMYSAEEVKDKVTIGEITFTLSQDDSDSFDDKLTLESSDRTRELPLKYELKTGLGGFAMYEAGGDYNGMLVQAITQAMA